MLDYCIHQLEPDMAKPLQPDRSQLNIRVSEAVKARIDRIQKQIEQELGFSPSVADVFTMGLVLLERRYGPQVPMSNDNL